MSVVAAAEKIGRRQAALGQARAVGAAADDGDLGRAAEFFQRSLSVGYGPGVAGEAALQDGRQLVVDELEVVRLVAEAHDFLREPLLVRRGGQREERTRVARRKRPVLERSAHRLHVVGAGLLLLNDGACHAAPCEQLDCG